MRRLIAVLVSLLSITVVWAFVPVSAHAVTDAPTTSTVATPAKSTVVLHATTRTYLLHRAALWVSQRVPYSETRWHANIYGSYRQDCSGFVSMAWGLPSSYVTWTLPRVSKRLATYDVMRGGDAIDSISAGHVMLFLNWTDLTHTTAIVEEESHTGTVAHVALIPRTYLVDHKYVPYRYDYVLNTFHDFSGDGRPDVLLTASDGALWMIPGIARRTSTPVRLLADISSFRYTWEVDNWMGTGYPTLLVIKDDYTLWRYDLDGTGRITSGFKVAKNLQGYDSFVSVGDMNGDGHADFAGRTISGRLYLFEGNGRGGIAHRVLMGAGLGRSTNQLIGSSDWNGDHIGDVMLVRSDGSMWLFAGNGHGGLQSAKRLSSGWNSYSHIVSAGDWNFDGRQDLVAVTSVGRLFLYTGNGKGGVVKRYQVASGWAAARGLD